jgi:choline-sulfatase
MALRRFPFRPLLGLLIASAVLGAHACGPGSVSKGEGARPAEHRPVVLVTIDTLRVDRVGAYGGGTLTPHLDALADSGVRFDAAIAQVPLTLASHVTILTGLRPYRHGVRTNDGFRLGSATPTLAEAFHAAGYATGAFVGAYPLASSTGLDRGFDRYDDDFLRTPGTTSQTVERRAGAVVDAALAWITEQPPSTPCFVWLHLFDPHTPYDPPPPYQAEYRDRPYDGEVAYTDASIGRLFDGLRALHVFDRAIVMVVADHGEGLGEHGELTHGTFLYDATIRVPLIIRAPGLGAARSVVTVPVETTDLAPTLAALAGVRLPDGLDGISLASLVDGAAGDPERATYAESYYQYVLLGWSPLRAVRTARWKFIQAPRTELYDLQADPGERRNEVSARAGLVRGLAAALPPPVAPSAHDASQAGVQPVSRDAAERLRSLGYASGRTMTTPASAIDPKDRIEVWSHLERAIDLLERDSETAALELATALKLDPRNGLALKYLGDLSYRAGRNQDASRYYRQALAAGFRHPDTLANLAAISARLGRPADAIRTLEEAVAREPGAADLWNQLGILHATSGTPQQARRAFLRAIELTPTNAEPYYNLALIDRREGDLSSARSRLQLALDRNPRYADAHFELGNVYLAERRLPDALAAYRLALAARPDYPEALFSAAHVEGLIGQRADAAGHYQQFIAVAPPAYREQVALARRELARLTSR